jgi:hypothetical protein
VYTSTHSTHADRIAYDEFSIRVEDACYSSVASLVAGVDDATYTVDATSTATDYTPNFDPDSGCAYSLTIKVKLASEPDSDYAAAGAGSYTWITNSSGYTAQVTKTDDANFRDPVVYSVWWHYVLTTPTQSEVPDSSADAYMQLTLVDLCWSNVPTMSSETSDIVFTISAAAGGDAAVAGTVNTAATTVSGCTITKTLEIFDPTANTWVNFVPSGSGGDNSANYPWIEAQSNAAGSISIKDDNTNNDYDSSLETVFELRWKNMDLRSKADGNILYDYFDVTIKWQCHLNTVVIGNSGEGIVDWEYELDNTARAQSASYTELYSACPTAVSMSCEAMKDDD